MILKSFSEYVHANYEKNALVLLNEWIISRLNRASFDKTDHVLQTELYYAENNNKKTFIAAKSETGRTLMQALYNFALSVENHKRAKHNHRR